MKNITSIILIIGIVLIANFISKDLFFRLDLTEGQQYTLSNSTIDVLEELTEPVTVSAYFSSGLSAELEKTKRDFKEMLIEYANASNGMVDYEFIDPDNDDAIMQEAAQNGVQPILINVREKDAVSQRRAFLGAVVKVGDLTDPLPVLTSSNGMEYAMTTAIKKLAVVDKPSVGLIQGHGEPSFQDLSQVYQSLSILYNVENVDLKVESEISSKFKTVIWINPKDSIPASHFQKVSTYLQQGGKLLVAANRVDLDMQNLAGSAINTGLETWLSDNGVIVEPAFLIDQNCGAVTVMQTQQMGFMRVQRPTQIQFPALPIISNYSEHPIAKGLEQVILPFASPLRFTGDTSKTFTPIAISSSKAGSINVPTQFDIQKQWSVADFPLVDIPLVAVVEGTFGGGIPSKMVVIGDGDFAITNPQQQQSSNNISLMVNAVDWLSDDTGLIELRTKGIAARPIDEAYLGDENASKRNFIKYLNFGLPLLLVIIYGFIRSSRQKNKRLKRMQESYV